jgi:hypothetical protein
MATRNLTEEQRALMAEGGRRSSAGRRAAASEGMKAAIEWRESRRCKAPGCGALAYEPCVHRPEGLVQA